MKRIGFKILMLIIMFFYLFQIISSEDIEERQRILFYPKDANDYYFRPIVDLEILDDVIFGVENRNHKIVAFKFEFPEIKYAFDVGRHGVGPGDLQYPLSLSIWKDEIAVKEQGYISFFKKNNEFSGKFRIFSSYIIFIFINDKIYRINPNIKEDYLFEIYTKKGKRISTFGTKFLIVDENTFPGKNPFLFQDQIYQGNLFSFENHLFYFNSTFGNYIQFSLNGEILKEGDISDCFGKRGNDIKKFNTEKYIERKNKKDKLSGYPKDVIFDDGYMHNNKLYFISHTFSQENGEQTIFDIRTISMESMNLLEKRVIRRKGVCRVDSMAVLERNGEDYILISLTDLNVGSFLELYR